MHGLAIDPVFQLLLSDIAMHIDATVVFRIAQRVGVSLKLRSLAANANRLRSVLSCVTASEG